MRRATLLRFDLGSNKVGAAGAASLPFAAEVGAREEFIHDFLDLN